MMECLDDIANLIALGIASVLKPGKQYDLTTVLKTCFERPNTFNF